MRCGIFGESINPGNTAPQSMFIKPVELASSFNSSSSWNEHASNSHFELQSRQNSVSIRSLLNVITNASDATLSPLFAESSPPSSPQLRRRKSVVDYKYRIILKFSSRKEVFVVGRWGRGEWVVDDLPIKS